MRERKIIIEVTQQVDDDLNRKPDQYKVLTVNDDKNEALEFGSFQDALQAFINRL